MLWRAFRLTLADPKMLNKRDFNVAKHTTAADNLNSLEWGYLHIFDNDGILAYSKADLERALRDLKEAEQMFAYLHSYLDTKMAVHFTRVVERVEATPEQIKSAMLEKLNTLRLFREALARTMSADQRTPPGPQTEQPA